MFWFIMYVNESIESTHREHVRFQGSNFVVLFTFKKLYFSSCFRFGVHIVSAVILTNYERTHKATTRQSVSNRFYWQSKLGPPICTPSGTKSCRESTSGGVYNVPSTMCLLAITSLVRLLVRLRVTIAHRQFRSLLCPCDVSWSPINFLCGLNRIIVQQNHIHRLNHVQ